MEHIFACCQPLSTRVAVARSTPDHETTASPASAASSTPHSFFSLLSPSQPPTPSPQAACDADARAVKVAEDPVSRPPPAKAFGYQTQAAEARRLASEAQERCSELEKLAAAAELAAGAHLDGACQEASAETQARAEEASGAIIVSTPHPLRRLAPNAGSFRRRGSEPCTLGASSTASRLHRMCCAQQLAAHWTRRRHSACLPTGVTGRLQRHPGYSRGQGRLARTIEA